jgi:hypothetical protein
MVFIIRVKIGFLPELHNDFYGDIFLKLKHKSIGLVKGRGGKIFLLFGISKVVSVNNLNF